MSLEPSLRKFMLASLLFEQVHGRTIDARVVASKMMPPTALPPIDPALRIGSVELAVSDLSRSANFYERVLGLPLISRGVNSALLGPDNEHPLLALTAVADPTPAPPGNTGLFHVAWLHPSRAALAETVRRVVSERWPLDGASDHGVSEALYLSDPDGLGIEIYVDRPRELWDRPEGGHGVKMVTLPLDLDGLLAEGSAEPAVAMPADTTIGHIHLKVADVPRAVSFYRDALGFEEQARLPSAGFLSAGGYHHHVGLNSWQSQGGRPAPDSAPGLRLIEFELSDAETLGALERRLEEAGDEAGVDSVSVRESEDRLALHDPDGHALVFKDADETSARI
jgi:catechol 2,3-dioxygenase